MQGNRCSWATDAPVYCHRRWSYVPRCRIAVVEIDVSAHWPCVERQTSAIRCRRRRIPRPIYNVSRQHSCCSHGHSRPASSTSNQSRSHCGCAVADGQWQSNSRRTERVGYRDDARARRRSWLKLEVVCCRCAEPEIAPLSWAIPYTASNARLISSSKRPSSRSCSITHADAPEPWRNSRCPSCSSSQYAFATVFGITTNSSARVRIPSN